MMSSIFDTDSSIKANNNGDLVDVSSDEETGDTDKQFKKKFRVLRKRKSCVSVLVENAVGIGASCIIIGLLSTMLYISVTLTHRQPISDGHDYGDVLQTYTPSPPPSAYNYPLPPKPAPPRRRY